MIYFNIIVSIVFIILSFIKKDSKTLFFAFLIWMWFLFTFSYGNSDYIMYKGIYEATSNDKVEIGFMLLCKIFHSIKVPYHVFLGIYGAICFGLIGTTIYKFSKKKSLIACFYFLCPFIFDTVQIRNFLAFAIVIFAFGFLVRNEKFDWLKYIVLNCIAVLFHIYSSICFIFVLLQRISKKKLCIITAVITAIELIIVSNKNVLIKILSLAIKKEKVYAYFESSMYTPGISTVLKSIIIIVLMIATLEIVNYLLKKKDLMNNIQKRFVELTSKICIIFIAFIPFLNYTTTIMRMPREIMLLIYICTSYILNSKLIENKKIKKENAIIYGLVLAFGFVWIQGFIVSINNVDLTYRSLLKNNILISLLNK